MSSPPDMSMDVDALRRRMHEVSALPQDDPDRIAIVAHISHAGGELEHEWLSLLRFDEELRLQLARVPVPPGLRSTLLEIPTCRET